MPIAAKTTNKKKKQNWKIASGWPGNVELCGSTSWDLVMSDAAEKKKDAIVKYQRLREEVDDLYAKLGQVESDRNEHEYVVFYQASLKMEGRRLVA